MSDYYQNNLPSESKSSFTSVFQETTGETEAATRNLALTIAEAASDRKAGEILLLKVTEVSYLADYFVMVTGYSRVQVRAIAQAIEDKVEEIYHRRPLRSEGKAEGSWVVQDYGEVIVHTMLPKEREFYNLEAFWGHGERIEFPASISVGD
ncbi:MAG: ribosome silencing factor [Nostocaceae cyanobacterium]|nr:ribosome silencing factor [Nostocaceae cyanobacterium]